MRGKKESGGKIDDRHLRLAYLGDRCTVCRRSIKAMEKRYLTSKGAFEFNHIDPAQKSATYEKLIRRVVSTEQFDELDKCNLLCRMCHTVWTNQRLKGEARITLQLPDGRIINKKFGLHGMVEIKNGQPIPRLFADNPQHLQPYAYILGKGRQIFRAGFELEKSLGKMLLATRRRRFLRIWDGNGLVFTAERLDASRLRCRSDVRFPIMKFELRPDDKDSRHVWIRDGKMVIRGERVRKSGQVGFEVEYAEIEHALAAKKEKGSA